MSIIQSFLNRLSETLSLINTFNPRPRLDPVALFFPALIVAVAVAFSQSVYSGIIGLFYLLILLLLLRPSTRLLSRYILLVLFLGVVPGIPLLFSNHGYINDISDLTSEMSIQGLVSFTGFSLRVFSSSLILITVMLHIGWQGLSTVFNRLSLHRFYFFINLVIVSIPRILRYILYLLIARESRTVGSGLGYRWRMLASVVGDTIIVSAWAGRFTGMAITARTFSSSVSCGENHSIGLGGILYIALSIFFLLIIMVLETGYVA